MSIIMSDERMLKVIIKKPKARDHQKDYNKHSFLRFIVEAAMKREKIDINTPNHIDHKLQEKIADMRKRRRPILVNPLQSKKPRFSSSCHELPLMQEKKEAYYFKQVVEVEEDKVVMVLKDVEDDDYDYKKEMKKKKTTKKSTSNYNKGKKTCKLPAAEPPNEEICKLMLEKISEIKGQGPIWLNSKIMTVSDQDVGLGRYYIPRSKELVKFLTKEELDIVEGGIPCRTLDQNGERWDLVLKYYAYLHQYAFLGSWRGILRNFGLLRPKAMRPKAKPKASKNAPKPKEDVPEVQIPGGKMDLWCFRDKDSSPSFAFRITRL